MDEIVDLRARLSEAEKERDRLKEERDRYPVNIFPENGESQDCKSAQIARVTCDNVKREFERLLEEGEAKP